MEEEIDYVKKISSMAANPNSDFIKESMRHVEQLRQRFNSIIAVTESRRELSEFFNDKDIENTF